MLAKAKLKMDVMNDFPILKRKINNKRLIYLDSAATSQKPKEVISSLEKYYNEYNANIHRGIYKLSEEATLAYEEAHRKVASFINCSEEEVIFTRNTTESLNLVAYSYGFENINQGDNIVVSIMEHHSNFVPWQQICMAKKAEFRVCNIKEDGTLDLGHLKSLIDDRTKIVALCHVSNTLGTINPIKEIAEIVHEKNSILIVDAAQSAPHMKLDVKDINADFLAFSAHKMLGPTGIGILYGKKELLEKMQPFLYGGDMIREVKVDNTTWNDLPWKFEAGTSNIADGIAFSASIDYLNKMGMDNIKEHEKEITGYALDKLKGLKNVKVYGPKERVGVISFNCFMDDGRLIHAHDVASILDQEGIAIRASHHCTMPLMHYMDVNATCRASFYIYNNKDDVDALINALKKVFEVFK